MTPFKNNHQFRGFLQRRDPVQPVQPMRSMSNDRPSEGPRVLQPQPVKQPAGPMVQPPVQQPTGPMVQPPAQPQAEQVNQSRMNGPHPGTPLAVQQEMMKNGPLVQPPQIPSKVAGQIKDVQSEFDQARASLEAKPEVSALMALSKQAATMDPNSPQAADLRARLEQAKGMLSQSPEYQRTLAAAQMLQKRAADEAAFQNGYAVR